MTDLTQQKPHKFEGIPLEPHHLAILEKSDENIEDIVAAPETDEEKAVAMAKLNKMTAKLSL